MNAISFPAHFDGTNILLDEPYTFEPNARLLVTVLTDDDETEALLYLSEQRLGEAYSDNEPEYSLTAIREMNPNYDRR